MGSAPSTARNDHAIDLRTSVAAIRRLVAPPIQFVGFWAAISLPFLYLPLLADGLHGTGTIVFASLLVLHVVALVLGHGHRRDE